MKHQLQTRLFFMECLTDAGREIYHANHIDTAEKMMASMVKVLEPEHKYSQAENN